MLPFTRFARYFIEVAKQGSLRRAAEVLHVSASAIDRHLLLAEEELGVALFERLPSGMRLTAAGEVLLADIQRWHKEYARTLERFDDLQGLRRGHVSIALMDALASALVPAAIAQIAAKHPGLTFSLQVFENRHIAAKVMAIDVDFGLALTDRTVIGLDIRALAQLPFGVALPLGHALAGQSNVAFGQTVGYRHIVAADSLTIHAQVASLYARYQLPAQQAVECNSIGLMRSLVINGVGIAVMSYLDVIEQVKQGLMAFVPLSNKEVKPLQLSLCVAPQRQLSRAAQYVMQSITEQCSDQLYSKI